MKLPVSPTRGKRNHPSNWADEPEKRETHCFYCGNLLGTDTHKPDCVCVTRSVVLEMRVQYVAEVPADWDVNMITFHRNESSWCADNDLEKIAEHPENHCICSRSEIKFIREAIEEDHRNMDFKQSEDD